MCKNSYCMETRFGRFSKMYENATARERMEYSRFRYSMSPVSTELDPILRKVWPDVLKSGLDVPDYPTSVQGLKEGNEIREANMREDGMVYYRVFKPDQDATGKIPRTEDLSHSSLGYTMEVKTTVGRFLRRIVEARGGTVKADCLATATAAVQAEYRLNVDRASKLTFKVIKGGEIADAYFIDGAPLNLSENMKFYSLTASCMRHEYLRPAFDIYTENSNISMLVALDPQRVLEARCLLWSATDGNTYYDRVYAMSPVIAQFTRRKAEELGFLRIPSTRIEVDLDYPHWDHYPYADTMRYLSISKAKLSNKDFSFNDTRGEIYSLESSAGGYFEYCQECKKEGTVTCERCHGETTEECPKCEGDKTMECTKCRGIGTTECRTCDGEGIEGTTRVKCTECSGDGEIDGEECSTCDGYGFVNQEVICSTCNGDKIVECSWCEGKCAEDCNECRGEGTIDCNECDGKGEVKCSECHGDGHIEHKGLDS